MRWRPVGPLKREIGWIFRTNGQRQAPAWGKHCEVNKGLCKAADKGDFWLVFLGGGEVIRLWLEKILRECTAKCYLFSLQRRSWENSLQFSMLYASLMFYVLYKINTTFEMRNIYIYIYCICNTFPQTHCLTGPGLASIPLPDLSFNQPPDAFTPVIPSAWNALPWTLHYPKFYPPELQGRPKGLLETLPPALSQFGLLLPSTVTVTAFKRQCVSESPTEAVTAPATHPQTLIQSGGLGAQSLHF